MTRKIVFTFLLTVFVPLLTRAQDPDSLAVIPGPLSVLSDTLFPATGSTALQSDSLLRQNSDTTLVFSLPAAADSSAAKKKTGSEITAQVDYNSADSLVFSNDGGTVEMFNTGKIVYGDITLEAAYIRYEMTNGIVMASGLPDSAGTVQGKPQFKEGEMSFRADSMSYNFKTQKAFIRNVITEQEGGFLHSDQTKRQNDGHIHLKDGKYTTCDAEHPHFYIAITKGISMPGDKIVSGPAYIVLEDVPLPIGIPFGFFPNSRTKTSGILIPQYGEEKSRGFYLRDGGYYFAMNDYMDLRVTGDIYSNGTWGVRLGSSYKIKYKFNGSLRLQFVNNVNGFKDIEGGYTITKDYSIGWSHNQDSKANPTSTFRASVNLSSSTFDRNQGTNWNNVMTNTKQSSISFTKSWPGTPFNLAASLNHSQNSNTQAVTMSLPKVSFSMSKINPFKKKKRVGPKKWYEDIQLSYTSLLENDIKTIDTLLFTSQVWDDMRNGFRHEIPLSLNIKPFKKIAALQTMTITPNVSYKGMVYTQYYDRSITGYTERTEDGVTYYDPVIRDTMINKLTYAHSYLPSISSSLAPKIYGTYQFKGDGRLKTIRHVMTPSASLSFTPDLRKIQPDYYRLLIDEVNHDTIDEYSIYEGQKYGTPTFNGANGTLSLSLRNNIEAKLRPKSDTVDKDEKIKLLDNFNFSTSMNLFAKDPIAPRWTPVNFNGNTQLFKNKLTMAFRGTLDPFAYDSTHDRIRTLYITQTGMPFRLTSASVTMGISFESKKDGDKKEGASQANLSGQRMGTQADEMMSDEEAMADITNSDYYGGYVDFDIPWKVKVDYSFSYTKRRDTPSIVQTLRLSGDFSLTPKWKIGFNTGYDIFNRKITSSNFSIHRDLHCWEMRMSVVPFGSYKSYNFTIAAKSSILSDLKYDKRKSWQDNFR